MGDVYNHSYSPYSTAAAPRHQLYVDSPGLFENNSSQSASSSASIADSSSSSSFRSRLKNRYKKQLRQQQQQSLPIQPSSRLTGREALTNDYPHEGECCRRRKQRLKGWIEKLSACVICAIVVTIILFASEPDFIKTEPLTELGRRDLSKEKIIGSALISAGLVLICDSLYSFLRSE